MSSGKADQNSSELAVVGMFKSEVDWKYSLSGGQGGSLFRRVLAEEDQTGKVMDY